MMIFKGLTIASAHRQPPSVHEILHRPARSLRRPISLLSMFPAVAGVQPGTSQSIKPRERDLGDLHLFFLVRILTRPTNHPRHAACASNHQSKPVRPRFWEAVILAGPRSISTELRFPTRNRARAYARDRVVDESITSTATKAQRQIRSTRSVSGHTASFSSAGSPHAISRSDTSSSTGSRSFVAMKRWVADQVRR